MLIIELNKAIIYKRHYEDSTLISASAAEIFAYIDDHTRISSHMNKSSRMMGGGGLETSVDAGRGQEVGSHILMIGRSYVKWCMQQMIKDTHILLHQAKIEAIKEFARRNNQATFWINMTQDDKLRKSGVKHSAVGKI